MRVNLSSLEVSLGAFFDFKKHYIAGEECTLICPNRNIFDIKWNDDNSIFRSSMWNSEGELISASYKKFFNFGEDLEYQRDLTCYNEFIATEKIDGSTLIVSKYKDEYIIRTRGNPDYFNQPSAMEYKKWLLELLEDNAYPLFETEYCKNCSLVFEIYTPNNQIVLNMGAQPRLFLTNIVRHDEYKYFDIEKVKEIAFLRCLDFPEMYFVGRYCEYKTVAELCSFVKHRKNAEGVCLYFSDNQKILKIKSDDYLIRHKLRYSLSNKALFELCLLYGFDLSLLADKVTSEILEVKYIELLHMFRIYTIFLLEVRYYTQFVKERISLTDFEFYTEIKTSQDSRVKMLLSMRKNKFNRKGAEERLWSLLETYTVNSIV